MPSETPDEIKARIARYRKGGMTVEQISEEVNCSISTASRYQHWIDPNSAAGPETATLTAVTTKGEESILEGVSRKFIETEDDAWEFGKFDRDIWYTHEIKCVAHQMGFVDKEGNPRSHQSWNIKLTLRRKPLALPKPLMDAADAIYNKLGSKAPDVFTIRTTGLTEKPVLAAFNLFDVHFGKLGWKPECGKDNDLRITEAAFRSAMSGLVDSASPHEIVRSVMAVGNDYCHFDNLIGTTTSGTPMDTDGRLAKVVEVATSSMIWAIEDLLKRSDFVDVPHVPGNHDRQTSYFICREIAAWFRNCDRVKVDADPIPRKYVLWERNLLGFTHGEGAKDPKSLPIIMATEKPREWAHATCREWHLGHNHTARKFVTRDMDEHCGVRMRWMSALSGSDNWAHHMGYVGNTQAAEVYLYRPLGYHGHFISRPE